MPTALLGHTCLFLLDAILSGVVEKMLLFWLIFINSQLRDPRVAKSVIPPQSPARSLLVAQQGWPVRDSPHLPARSTVLESHSHAWLFTRVPGIRTQALAFVELALLPSEPVPWSCDNVGLLNKTQTS